MIAKKNEKTRRRKEKNNKVKKFQTANPHKHPVQFGLHFAASIRGKTQTTRTEQQMEKRNSYQLTGSNAKVQIGNVIWKVFILLLFGVKCGTRRMNMSR